MKRISTDERRKGLSLLNRLQMGNDFEEQIDLVDAPYATGLVPSDQVETVEKPLGVQGGYSRPKLLE